MTVNNAKGSPPFFSLDPEHSDLETAAAVLLPIPYERTASWRKGTAAGPEAIREASAHVELWDLDTNSEPYRHGIAQEPALNFQGPADELAKSVEERVGRVLDRRQIPIVLGGDHSVSIGAIAATARRFPKLSVLQIDAHADTRETYQGSTHSHACVMARARELCPIVQVGLRSADKEELPALEAGRVFWATDIARDSRATWIHKAVEQLSEEVYVTIDIDAFDPAIVPATGTPEPGGLDWYQVNDLLAATARQSRVVAFDVVELMGGHAPSAFTAAKLIYRFLAEILRERGK